MATAMGMVVVLVAAAMLLVMFDEGEGEVQYS